MQLSVTQTITSTENNYKANVNFTGGEYSYCRFGSEPKISNIAKEKKTKSKYNMKASSLTPKKTEELKRSYKHSLQR